jgi:hypothetical protein
LKVLLQVLDNLEGPEEVAVPEEPLEPLELKGRFARQIAAAARAPPFDHLGHDREAHSQVEPVEHVLGLGVQVERQLAHVLSAVGQEGDLLVRLHPLRLEELQEAALGPAVVGLDKTEALGRALGRHALARDHLKPALPRRSLCAGVHVASIEAHGQRQLRPGQLAPLPLAALSTNAVATSTSPQVR